MTAFNIHYRKTGMKKSDESAGEAKKRIKRNMEKDGALDEVKVK